MELLSLKVKDINLQNDLLLVSRAKNKKQRYIPISAILHDVLSEYLIIRNGASEDYLFPNSFGNQLAESTLRTNIIYYHRSRGLQKTSIHL